MRAWAGVSGVLGLVAAAFLVLFYVAARPWEAGGQEGWYGLANDVLTALQYVALVPVVVGLGRLMPGDARARRWTRVGLVASIGVVVLQVLLVTGLLPFAYQVVPVSLCGVAAMCWAGGISAAGARAGALPGAVTGFGRAVAVGLPVAVVAFAVGALVTAVFDVPWAWVAGGVPGVVVWAMFPAWAVLLAAVRPGTTSVPGRT
ncbi:hypothetical protein ACIBG8_07925 [Nonomuraea sp. NPDC050556]|uniref:hypothetical protein n=1 Tax=Nonomuraea sp. NPDC050556 TaxID=3364369 RepID=UPI0037A81E64